jgi:hypothetical protein
VEQPKRDAKVQPLIDEINARQRTEGERQKAGNA